MFYLTRQIRKSAGLACSECGLTSLFAADKRKSDRPGRRHVVGKSPGIVPDCVMMSFFERKQ